MSDTQHRGRRVAAVATVPAVAGTMAALIAGANAVPTDGSAAAAPQHSHPARHGRCYPAARWAPAPDAVRPCASIARVWEDGSVTVRVQDADGVVRYTVGIGNRQG